MAIRVNVAGGTNAGCKRPLRQPAQNWACSRKHRNRGYATACLTCGERRP